MVDSTMEPHFLLPLQVLTYLVELAVIKLVRNSTLLKRLTKWDVQTLTRTPTVEGSQLSNFKAMEQILLRTPSQLTLSTKMFW